MDFWVRALDEQRLRRSLRPQLSPRYIFELHYMYCLLSLTNTLLSLVTMKEPDNSKNEVPVVSPHTTWHDARNFQPPLSCRVLIKANLVLRSPRCNTSCSPALNPLSFSQQAVSVSKTGTAVPHHPRTTHACRLHNCCILVGRLD